MSIQPKGEQQRIIRRGPAPDYSQRSVKLRLFMYVAAVMLTLAAIERARDPQTWQWLWHAQPSAAPAEAFNNRLDANRLRTAADPPGTFVAASDANSAAPRAGEKTAFDPVQRAWEQGWQEVLSRLPPDEQGLLFETLSLSARNKPPTTEKAAAASEMAAHAERLWDDYQAAAFQSVASLTGDDRSEWVDVLHQVNSRFAAVRTALAALIGGRGLTNSEQTALADLESTLVAQALAQVQDDTVVFRPAEREIWFHELERVRDGDADQLSKASLGRVGYLQLHKQPADYRGKLVTVAGTVRLAYRVAAPPNYLGVKEYCVYWLHPAGGPDSPLLVYALGVPPGFPPLSNQNADGKQQPQHKLREDVQVTGVFFKRCAYAAQGGTYTAPLLITNVPVWHRPAGAPTAAPFTVLELAAMAVGALLLSICLTAVIWKRSRRSHHAKNQQRSGGLVALGSLTIGPSPEESIRELERQARNEGKS